MNENYDDRICAEGDRRLANWGDWCAGDTSRKLQMPSRTPFADMYQPEKGDVWVENIEAEAVISDSEAARVEQEVLRMADRDRYLLMLAYINKYPVTSKRRGVPSIVRRMGWDEDGVRDALARICHHVGQIRM
jgi:hypothetical protein